MFPLIIFPLLACNSEPAFEVKPVEHNLISVEGSWKVYAHEVKGGELFSSLLKKHYFSNPGQITSFIMSKK